MAIQYVGLASFYFKLSHGGESFDDGCHCVVD